MADTHQKEGGTTMVANILAIVGSIILVLIIIWGLIHLLSLSGGFFSSLFGNSDSIEITAPETMTSGETAKISWKHEADESGMYAILYPCTEGLRFSTPGPDQAFITMPCGAAFAVGQSVSNATILPMLATTEAIKTPLSVVFIPSSTSSTPVEGTVTVSVNPASAPVLPAPEEPEEPETPAEPEYETPEYTPVSHGPADLAVTITGVSIDQFGNGTVTFNISNIGGSASGSYYFTAQLPTAQPYTYLSPTQVSLARGAYIVNTLSFTGGTPGQVFIALSPSSADYNTGNNTATKYVSGQYPYQYNYQQQYQYTQPYNYLPSYYDVYNYPYSY